MLTTGSFEEAPEAVEGPTTPHGVVEGLADVE